MNSVTLLMHELLFNIPNGERLSGVIDIDQGRLLMVPAVGGLAVGIVGLAVATMVAAPRRRSDRGNALYGGRMSLNDSLIVMVQTILSNSVGASIGLEAGFTQIGSAVASRLGRSFRVRRSDLRLLVGCGAAAAIGAAFNAPLTGAFYAFELVIGTYSLVNLAPVVAAIGLGHRGRPADPGRQRRVRHAHPDGDRAGRLSGGAGARRHVRVRWHCDHAWRDPHRGHVPPQPRARLAAPDGRRHGRGPCWR